MMHDEVYQAALSAGSGGIRWNSTAKYIQVMDENKNWRNYKRWDPDINMRLCALSSSGITTTLTNYTFPYNGTYLAFCSRYQGSGFTTISTNASQLTPIINYTSSDGTRRGDILFFNAEPGNVINTLTYQASGSCYCRIALIFIGDLGISAISMINGYTISENNYVQTDSTGIENCILIGATNSAGTVTFVHSNSNSNLVTDGVTHGVWTDLFESGTCTVKAKAGLGCAFVAALKVNF